MKAYDADGALKTAMSNVVDTLTVTTELVGLGRSSTVIISDDQPEDFEGQLWFDTSTTGNVPQTVNYKHVITTYTVESGDVVLLCNAALGAFTVTLLPVATGAGQKIYVKKTDPTANVVTIDGNLSETIDGATTQLLSNQYDSLTLVSDGVESWIL